jgi:hypothetical protein
MIARATSSAPSGYSESRPRLLPNARGVGNCQGVFAGPKSLDAPEPTLARHPISPILTVRPRVRTNLYSS